MAKGRKKDADRDLVFSFNCGLWRTPCPWRTPRLPREEALELARAHVIQAHPEIVPRFHGAAA